MNALSPVSADLIGRLRKMIEDDKIPRGRALVLLERAEKATTENAEEVSREILTYLGAINHWSKLKPH